MEGTAVLKSVTLPGWLDELRRREVTDRVGNDPRSSDDTLLGLSANEAFEAISGGQADFDVPRAGLSADDLALLYAHLNQKGHLEELLAAFGQLLAESNLPNPIVVDVGCGPFTGGLALAATLGDDPRFDYIGVDRAASMRGLGGQLASSDLVPGTIACHWATDLDSVDWQYPPGWRPVIVVISYLFASPTLDAEAMFVELDALLSRLGNGDVTLLYTNSMHEEPNVNYPEFRAKLEGAGFQVFADDHGMIIVERWNGPQERYLRYALFHRPRQQILPLEE